MNGVILTQNLYLINPFKKSIDILVERRTSDNIFQKIMDILLDYFSTIKEHRTIYDIDKAIEKIEDFIDLEPLEIIDEKTIAEEIKKLKTELQEFISGNFEKIEDTIDNAKTGFLVQYWLSNIEITIKVLEETQKEFRRKYRFLSGKSSREKEFLNMKLERIYKSTFLVFFRIIEQIYMISEGKEFIPEEEINFLIEDVVYLENIARATHDNI